MLAYTDKIKNIAKKLLNSNKVTMVIGFRKGSLPMTSEPCYITSSEDAELLIWDSSCRSNLANYLINCKEKIAVIVKGCDSRSIITLITENKISRDQLYIIGVPCTGMIDRKKINAIIHNEIITVIEKDDQIIVQTTEKHETSIMKNEVLQTNCNTCLHHNPVISDELVSDTKLDQKQENVYKEVSKLEKMNHEDKWNYFDNLFSTCLRCYACRNVCPLCYCPVCFVDESKPQWVGKGQEPIDIKIFHFLRAYHCAGRCTDCGACEQACPVGINMRILTKKLEKDCITKFNWEAGLSLENRPAMDVYSVNDPENFIK